MKNILLNLLGLDQPYAEHELLLKYKVVYLNSIYLLVAPVALVMGIYRWQLNPLMGMLDFILSGSAIALHHCLKRHRDKVELISTISISITFCVFYGIYLFDPYQATRLSSFFLVLAAAFLLKGLRTGVIWLLFIILMIAIAQFIPAIKTGYSNFDIIASCVYLVALFLIFWNYETLKKEQYQREKELHLQNLVDERWRLALESTGDAIWDWNILVNHLDFSKSYAEMLGYNATEIEPTPEHLETLLHPQDKLAAIAHLEKYLIGEIEGQYVSEQRLRCKDGSYKWILCRGSVIARSAAGKPERMIGTHIDITPRKQIEQALKISEFRWKFALEGAGDGVWDWEIETNTVHLSKRWKEMLGYAENEIGNTLDECESRYHPDDKDYALTMLSEYLDNKITSYNLELRVRCKDGQYLWILDRGMIVSRTGSGKPLRMIGTYTDITERKRIENDLRLTQQQLRGLSKVANEALESERKRTARDLHDELGQLLVASKMYLGTLRAALPANNKKLDALGEDMLTILNTTISATRRIASDLRPPILDDVGLAAALEWLIDSFSKQSEITFKLSIDGNSTPIFEPIASALYRITQESLTNVVKHSQATSVEIRLIQNAHFVELTFSDNGRGIEVSDQGKQGSFGLLGIRERVILLAGEFSIAGTPDQGTNISVKVPVVTASLSTVAS
jgi:PAS domain S-box-containing protein